MACPTCNDAHWVIIHKQGDLVPGMKQTIYHNIMYAETLWQPCPTCCEITYTTTTTLPIYHYTSDG